MAVPFSENGGFAATTFFLFMPSVSTNSGNAYIAILDPSSFDDADDSSSYTWRMEDIQPGRYPTVRKVILIYRDLGVAKLTVTVTGTNDLGISVSAFSAITIGSVAASGNLVTAFVDIGLAAFRPQLSIFRPAGGGPVSIISATLIGTCEEVSL